jgi:hypothetical protein
MAIRHAIRSLVRSPWYGVTAIGTITLTIALAATVFAVIDGVLFRPLPYPDPDRVFRVTGVDATGGSASLAPADVRYLAETHPGILVALYRARASVVRPAQPELEFTATQVGPRFFDRLGQPPVIGGFVSEHFDARPICRPRRPGSSAARRLNRYRTRTQLGAGWRRRAGGWTVPGTPQRRFSAIDASQAPWS